MNAEIKTSSKPRNVYLDFMKGILILLVLLGHVIQYGSGTEYLTEGLYWDNWIMKGIYSFHMPLFMVISGYLSYGSFKRKGAVNAFEIRLKKLIKPILAWIPIVIGVNCMFNAQPISFRGVIRTFLTDFWFLWAVLIATGYMILFERIPQKMRIGFYFISFLIAFFSPDILWLNAYKFVVPYFVVGFVCARNSVSLTPPRKILSFGLLCTWIVLMLFYSTEHYVYLTKFSIFGKPFGVIWLEQLIIDVYRYIVGFVGCGAILFIGRYIWHRLEKLSWASNKILWLGRHSIAVYILSTYMFTDVVARITATWHPNIILWILETAATTVICTFVTKMIHKSKRLAALFIGE